jgi:hypothetical protein
LEKGFRHIPYGPSKAEIASTFSDFQKRQKPDNTDDGSG